jgi:hypothetical protein
MRKGCGLSVLIAGFVLLMFLCTFGSALVGGIFFEFMWFAPSDARNYDPIAQFDAVYDRVGRNNLFISMEARYVRSDGTLDLWATYDPRVNYQFMRTTLPINAKPIGAGGNAEGVQYNMTRLILDSKNDGFHLINFIMDADYWIVTQTGYEPAPPPTCPLRDLWATALAAGASDLAVATIEYDAEGYDFEIRDTDFRFRFGVECALIE